ncbi:MAG: hypothetical protein A2341_19290 [Deltaproteobacteria bacterium RIFOXYB12_FULL_58_9]|nr:MAG: hypothetical protein A2341_19290 [Deltaproteobacteria bacterium RIFOXYB12_FULL_58_9]
MKMQPDDVREAVLKAIRQLLEDPTAVLTDETSPIDGLDLDSEDGLDFADSVSEALGVEIPVNVNPFKNDDEQKPRKIGEIIALIVKLSQKEDV